MSEEQGQQPSPPGNAKISREAQEQAIPPRMSYWPFALAVAVIVILVGIMTHPVVMGIGAFLAIIAVIGWGLERR